MLLVILLFQGESSGSSTKRNLMKAFEKDKKSSHRKVSVDCFQIMSCVACVIHSQGETGVDVADRFKKGYVVYYTTCCVIYNTIIH